VRRAQVGSFSEQHIKLLQTFAAQAVIAIENVRLFNETKEALERQTATAEILKVISSSPTDVQPVFDAILARAAALCGATLGSVFRYDGVMLEMVACSLPGALVEILRREYPAAPNPGKVSGRVVLERRIVAIPDVRQDLEYKGVAPIAGGHRSLLGVPLLRGEKVIGAIVIARHEPGNFTPRQIAMVETFAAQAVIAIENVRLVTELQSSNSTLRDALDQQTATAEILKVISESPTDLTPVFHTILDSAMRLCEAHLGTLNLYDGEWLNTVAQRGGGPEFAKWLLDRGPIKPDGGATYLAITERRAMQIADVREAPGYREGKPNIRRFVDLGAVRTFLAVPLLKEGNVVGNIGIYRPEARPFTDKQIAIVSVFANQAVIALENARLFNETAEALEQQKALADVLAVISRAMSALEPIFETILSNAIRLCEGTRAVLWRYDGSRLHVAAHKHGHPQGVEYLREHPLELGTYNATPQAALERRAVHVVDAFADPNYRPLIPRGIVPRSSPTPTVLAVPLLRDDDLLGVITIWRTEKRPFTDKQITMVNAFASQAVIAIENARLFRQIQEKSAELEMANKRLELANKHKSEFLANMSHELRTPLNAIIGFSEAMMEQMFGELNEKQLDYQKDINESGKHLLSLINDILDLSKIEAGRMELELSTFHLPTALSNAVTLIRERAQRHGIALGVEIDEGLGEFQADERKVKQILLNLLSNAVKFTPDGGRVEVSAKLDTDKVEISVKDTGVGITPEDQASLFEEFKQLGKDSSRRGEGTGLGLALTKKFVELHGGAMRVESAPGKGSTFMFSLPLRSS
jgi:signal transduction histidine kinase